MNCLILKHRFTGCKLSPLYLCLFLLTFWNEACVLSHFCRFTRKRISVCSDSPIIMQILSSTKDSENTPILVVGITGSGCSLTTPSLDHSPMWGQDSGLSSTAREYVPAWQTAWLKSAGQPKMCLVCFSDQGLRCTKTTGLGMWSCCRPVSPSLLEMFLSVPDTAVPQVGFNNQGSLDACHFSKCPCYSNMN